MGERAGVEELAQAEAFVKANAERPAEGTRDLLWALMTSAGFWRCHKGGAQGNDSRMQWGIEKKDERIEGTEA